MGDASWFPLYDLHATSEGGKPSKSVSLHYRVNLQQKTGEDWKDAKLILSTSATDMLDAGVPVSDSLTVQPKEKPQSPVVSMENMKMRSVKTKKKCIVSDSPGRPRGVAYGSVGVMSPPAPPPPLVQTTATVSRNPMAVNYTVDEPTTIPSDPLSHKVLVAVVPFEAMISHITSPRKSPIAYLQVDILLSVHPGIKRSPDLANSAPLRIRAITICFLAP